LTRDLLPPGFADDAAQIVGSGYVKRDAEARERYGEDAVKQGHPADLVVLPGSTSEVAAIAGMCDAARVPLVVRGGGTGYTGGAVPIRGGVVLSLERMNRILEIDEANLLAVVEPNVITGSLQDAVEAVGLFYPPDPASLRESVIGGNVAECAGGPRAFKYGTTRNYVLGLEAVLPTGEIIRTGSKAVKNVVGYDLTRLIVGSEGTLAIVTQVVVRLVPKPPVQVTLQATFESVDDAVAAVTEVLRARVVPATIELVDAECLEAVTRYVGDSLAPAGTGALLLIEVDGFPESVGLEAHLVEGACRTAGATEVRRAATAADRDALWRVRRELSPALKTISPLKLNNDVVVPKGRLPELFELVQQLKQDLGLRIPCFGHAGDGNIHVNIMVEPGDAGQLERARTAVGRLFEGVVALEGSISGEHGIGLTKAPYLGIELSADTIALMKRLKQAFDPHGILNPGKIFPSGDEESAS
jgi:glycolate oxidase